MVGVVKGNFYWPHPNEWEEQQRHASVQEPVTENTVVSPYSKWQKMVTAEMVEDVARAVSEC